MRITTVEVAEKLIGEQYDQLISAYKLLEILSRIDISKDSESLSVTMKYYCFIMSSYADLVVILKGFINSSLRWEEIFYSKKGFLVIYESIKTYDQNQKNIRDVISKNFPTLEKLNQDVNIKLKSFKKTYKHQSKISQVRNETAGHYNVDFDIYYSIIQTLDKPQSIEMIENFLIFLMDVINLVEKITKELKMKVN